MMGFFEDADRFQRGYSDRLPQELVADLRGLRDRMAAECVTETDEIRLRMRQGAAIVLKEICEVLDNGVIALPRDGGISMPM